MKPVRTQVHRFGGTVALYIGTGETVYISPQDARKLARAINACARSVKTEPNFSKSTIGTFSAEFSDARAAEFAASEEQQQRAADFEKAKRRLAYTKTDPGTGFESPLSDDDWPRN